MRWSRAKLFNGERIVSDSVTVAIAAGPDPDGLSGGLEVHLRLLQPDRSTSPPGMSFLGNTLAARLRPR
jgi:hypothetical protein